jgi:hypothetical protein
MCHLRLLGQLRNERNFTSLEVVCVKLKGLASEITGLPRDNFELYEISKDEFESSVPNTELSAQTL